MIGPVTAELIDQVTSELRKNENQTKIRDTLVDPLVQYLHSKIFNYLQFLGLLIGIMIALLVIILFMVWKRKI